MASGKIKVHVLRTGEVRVSPYLPFGGDAGLLKASGITTPKSQWIWLPVFSFFIEHPKARIVFDTGWHREMSPAGVFDKAAQIRSLGSRLLYGINQGRIAQGEAIHEQLAALGVQPSDIDLVLISHLDCDHVNGLRQLSGARSILVSEAEMQGAARPGFQNRIRFQRRWWDGTGIGTFDWNGTEGPVGHSYDVLGDGSLTMVHIPGHSEGLCALKIRGSDGRYVLLFADGGYGTRSWRDMITSGVALDKRLQRQSLLWIREQSLSADCVESIATHDAQVAPHTVEI